MYGIPTFFCDFLASHSKLIEDSGWDLEQPKGSCGEGEIRTRESLRTEVFKTSGMNHYPTSPCFSAFAFIYGGRARHPLYITKRPLQNLQIYQIYSKALAVFYYQCIVLCKFQDNPCVSFYLSEQ